MGGVVEKDGALTDFKTDAFLVHLDPSFPILFSIIVRKCI